MKNLCQVCGARNPAATLATTCDHVCKRAKQAGLTRGQQMFYDMRGMKFYGRRLPPRPSRTVAANRRSDNDQTISTEPRPSSVAAVSGHKHMNILKKFTKLFTGEKPADAAEPPPIPIKIGPRLLRFGPGFRFPARSRVYRKRPRPTRFIDRQPVQMSFRQARMHDIWTSMREANEIRRSHRERQLERRAA